MSVARVVHQSRTIDTEGRGFIEITALAREIVRSERGEQGICHVFVRHTSASLLITENADSDVLRDMETVFADLAPDGDSRYIHSYEGPDDMAAHLRCALTQTTLSIPVIDGQLMLGTWQGLFLWEHRYRPHRREIVFSFQGSCTN
ncbi:MAG: secondary thiamine-phosphate synthase enzyme YjbQ [Granulosicoccaceae bacterium]